MNKAAIITSILCAVFFFTFSFAAAAAVWYVDKDNAAGPWDGTSWSTAFATIQEGVNAAAGAGGEVWVAEGVYNEVRLSDATGALAMAPNVHLYGGFVGLGAGGGEDAREDRDWTSHATIIDGANGRGAGVRAYHVVAGADNATLDGFTVTGGDANSNTNFPINYAGGGMVNMSVSPLVSNCVFTGNHAGVGGGMANGYTAAPTIADCTFYDNHTHIYVVLPAPDSLGLGGGAVNVYGAAPDFLRCTFDSNTAEYIGGGVGNVYNTTPELLHCTFDSNTAGSFGGGVYNFNGSTPVIDGCLFKENQSTLFGGGLFGYQNVSSQVKNCRFLNNTSQTGGAVDHEGNSSIVMNNCVFAGNVGSSRGSGLSLFSSTATVTNCTFNDGPSGDSSRIYVSNASGSLVMENSIVWSTSATPILLALSGTATVSYSNVYGGYAGTGNIGANTVADDPDFVDAPAQDLRVASGSPCIDTANPAGVPPAPSTDIRGVPRPQDGLVDMGAYEYDHALPIFSNIAPSPALAKVGTVVTLTFTVSEPLAANPAVTVNGHAAAYSSNSGLDYAYTYVIDESDDEGSATIEVGGSDFAGNANSLSDSSGLTIDKTAPEFSDLVVTPAEARPGDTVQIAFTSSEPLSDDPEVTVNGTPAIADDSKSDYTFSYLVSDLDLPGPAAIEIQGQDVVGNSGFLSDSVALTIAPSLPMRAGPVVVVLLMVGVYAVLRRCVRMAAVKR